MVHISKKKIKQDVFEKIHHRLAEAVVSLKRPSAARSFVEEMLTPAERVLLVKRLSIIFMLIEGASPYRIHKTLAVSTSTVRHFREQLDEGSLSHVTTYFKDKKKREQFWNDLETITRAGMPPVGRGRWAWLNKMDEKYKRRPL